MTPSLEQRLLKSILARGLGRAFSAKDFPRLATRGAVDVALHRLAAKGDIRRIIRGVYDQPRWSKLLGSETSPDIDEVAAALARKFGWHIQPSGATALNLLGLSSQVPAGYLYLSDGPDRSYNIGDTRLTFKHTALKDGGFRHRESSLIVQALKSLGKDNATPEVIAVIRKWPAPRLRGRILQDTSNVTGWVYAVIRMVCMEEDHEQDRESEGS